MKKLQQEILLKQKKYFGKNDSLLLLLLLSPSSLLLLFHFFFFFFLYSYISWYSNIVIIPFCSFLSITIRSGCLASIRLSHWIFMSHSTLISLFSTAPSGACPYHFLLCSNLFFLQISQ